VRPDDDPSAGEGGARAGAIVSRRRRRGVVLALVAIGCGLLAAANVRQTVERVESRTGAPVPVVVATADIAPGTRLDRRRAARRLALREVPARNAPRDGLVSVAQAIGLEAAVPVPAGAYLTAPMLRDPRGRVAAPVPVRRGERLIEIAVTGGRELAAGGLGARVDVLVTSEGRTGRGRTFVALENVELVAARPARPGALADADGTPADTVATLRVGARAAVFLTAAQNFAREVRLLARPAGDRRRVGRAEVGDGRL
jgi:pilus assembly protein CpaB